MEETVGENSIRIIKYIKDVGILILEILAQASPASDFENFDHGIT